MKIKELVIIVMVLGGFSVGLACAIIMVINQFRNPDMTQVRLLMEYSNIVITEAVAIIIGYIGLILIGKEK